MISAQKAKHLDATTMFTYSHANTPLGQSERAYYLSYFIIGDNDVKYHLKIAESGGTANAVVCTNFTFSLFFVYSRENVI